MVTYRNTYKYPKSGYIFQNQKLIFFTFIRLVVLVYLLFEWLSSLRMSLKRKEPMRDYSDEETEHEKDDVSLDGSIDSAEDARRQNDRENGEDGTTKLKTSEPAAEELLRTKRQRFNKPFTEDLLVGYEGMQRIYSEFPLHCQAKVPRGGEMNYLNRLLTRYKEWAFQLHPGLAFPDVVAKCEALGSKARVRNVLIQMRHSERDRYIVSKPLSIAI